MLSVSRPWRHALTVATLGTALVAAPAAHAEIISVGDGRNVGIFHNIDFVAGFGWEVDQPLTVEVFRNGQRIGSATGPTVELDEGLPLAGALEVNHGPEGEPQPGDCWTRYTPDIMPGDEVRLTQGTQTDRVLIDPITVDRGPLVNAAGHVQVEGRASSASGTPIAIAALDSGGVLNTSRFRGGPSQIFRTPGTTDGWTMTFDPASPMDAPGRDGREPAGLSTADRLALLLSGEYTIGYGHVAPLPRETQLFDGNEDAPGPALGCEASPSESNAVSSTDDSAINVASGDLVVTGKAMAGTFDADITQVIPKISDGTTTLSGAAIDVTGNVRNWTATFDRARLATLADGRITISADYVTASGTIGGHTRTLVKDVVAPALTAGTAPGEYTGPISVALSAGPGDRITFRTDGLPHGPSDREYSGPIALGFGTTTIAVRVTDAAGNVTDRTLTYTVNRPPVPAGGQTAGGGGTTAGGGGTTAVTTVPTPVGTAPGALAGATGRVALRAFATPPRVKRSRASRYGIRVVMRVGSDAKVVRIRVYRSLAGGRRVLVSSAFRSPRGAGVNRLSLRDAALRRKLRIGSYEVEATPGAGRSDLGATSRARLRIVAG